MTIPFGTLGFPRIGPDRELKHAVEAHWAGRMHHSALLAEAARLRAATWGRQGELRVTRVPSNDFSFYDHVLDTAVMLGAVPPRYGWDGQGMVPLETYFAMARGRGGRGGVPALEMTKWFDTNYHYLVPELSGGQEFQLASTKPVDEFLEARRLGVGTRPVLVGPLTFLHLSKMVEGKGSALSLLPGVLPVYSEVVARLAAAGATEVQIDEPILVLDLDDATRAAFRTAYTTLAGASKARLLLTTYFGSLGDNADLALSLPVSMLHLDLVRAPNQAADLLPKLPEGLGLSLGVVDGRNVWRSDLAGILDRLEPVVGSLGPDRVQLAPSCSLLHVPMDLEQETEVDAELRGWLAFAVQKIDELAVLSIALAKGRDAVAEALEASSHAVQGRRSSPRVVNSKVRARTAAVGAGMFSRRSPYAERRTAQKEALDLPLFPTTTIGSFPQSHAVREARARHRSGALDEDRYEGVLRGETEAAIRWQEELGLDVLVHGEFERTDMVEHFGLLLDGYAVTTKAWVQSYGSRCVRPPILYGDIVRSRPMTLSWAKYAQSLTSRPVKGMLTGPITMLQWSFVRDDLPRSEVGRQIALALRDEVADLEEGGIRVIQIDEPALREGLPLRRTDWDTYLRWSVDCFRLASAGVLDGTQIHTHMCYAEFNDIMDAIEALDADVISIECARSRMELLEAFRQHAYPNEMGPGVYDIHSPRCPEVQEMVDLLRAATKRLAPERVWVNPDCGLKTRRWEEVRPAIANMVTAARRMRRDGLQGSSTDGTS